MNPDGSPGSVLIRLDDLMVVVLNELAGGDGDRQQHPLNPVRIVELGVIHIEAVGLVITKTLLDAHVLEIDPQRHQLVCRITRYPDSPGNWRFP